MAIVVLLRRRCACATTLRRLRLIFAAVLGMAFSSAASASLIFDSIRYDGRVREGATAGVEKHSTTDDLLANSFPVGLPADNSMLPDPLDNGNNLNATLSETVGSFNGMPVQHAILNIQSSGSLFIFNNTLDPTLAYPVEFDAIVYSNSLAPNDAIGLQGIGVENFNFPPYPAPGSQIITGVGNPSLPLGSVGNPMRIQLGIAADQVDDYRYGFIKLNFYYKEVVLIPEPAAWILLITAVAGVVAARRQFRRGS
jgi:hypothetical protein